MTGRAFASRKFRTAEPERNPATGPLPYNSQTFGHGVRAPSSSLRSLRPADEYGPITMTAPTVTRPPTPTVDTDPEPIGHVTWLLIAITLVPIVVAIVRILTGIDGNFHAVADNGLNELLVRDLGKHPILLGPYSRDGWSHPGPLFYYLSWLPYRLFGSNSAAMLIDALLINGVAVGVMIAIAKRWGGLALAVPVAIACGAVMVNLPGNFLEDPWNPFITVLPFGAFLMAAWATVCGDRWAFPVAVFIGTFCMQTHIGYAALVIAVLAWCTWRAWRDRATFGLTELGWAAAVLALLWVLPVLEQLVRDPGNLRTTFEYFKHPTDKAHTLAEGLRVMAAQFTLTPDWIVGLRDVNPFSGQPAAILTTPIPLLLAPFLVAVGAAFRSRHRATRQLAIVLIIPLVVGVFALSRTIGSMYEYRLRWVWVLAALCIAFTVATLVRAVRSHLTPRASTVAVAMGVLAAIALGSVGVANATHADPVLSPGLTALGRRAMRHLPPPPGVVLVQATSFSSQGTLPGFILMLERAGIRVKLDNIEVSKIQFGAHRMYAGEPIRARLVLADDTEIEEVASRPGAREIAYVSTISRAARARAIRRRAELVREGKSQFDPEMAVIVRDLHAQAVFAFPVADH